MKFYTGVGSRRTPDNILLIMKKLAQCLDKEGYVLRSGGAKGADLAFESGSQNKQIYYAKDAIGDLRALELASKFHPAWNRCSDYAKLLHARNCYQVLGKDLDNPSEVLTCWTPDGCVSSKTRTIETGGTATAICIAEAFGIPICNLRRKEDFDSAMKYINSMN